MNLNFHANYGYILLGSIEIYIGLFLFISSYIIDKHNLRKNKLEEAKTFFKNLNIAKKSLLILGFILFILSILILILYLDLPESQSLKNTMTWPLVILGALAFSYNSLIDSKKADDSAKKTAVIEHLIKNKAFYKNLIVAIFCGIFVITGIKTILIN